MQKINRISNIFLPLLLLTNLGLRLTHLTIMPIFGDEAIYLNWSQTIAEDPKQLFLPLSDGKQPLFMWLVSLATMLFSDPLFTARVISVFAGCFGLLGVYLIVKKLYGVLPATLSGVCYLLCPIIMFYDRLAVPDNLLSVLGIWIFYCGLLLLDRPKITRTIMLGVVIGLGLLTKSPAIFFVLLLPTLVLFKLSERSWFKQSGPKFVVHVLGSIAIGLAISSILRLSPLYSVIGLRTWDFVFKPSHLLESPLDPLVPRIPVVAFEILGYLTPMLVGFALIGVIFAIYKKQKAVIVFSLWFLCPLLIEMALAKGFTPRYYLFTIPYLVVIAGLGLYWLLGYGYRRMRLLVGVVLLLFFFPAQFIYYLIVNPALANIPPSERAGYLEDWTAGYGIFEVSQYLKYRIPRQIQVLAGTEGHFGTLPDGLIAYNRKSPNIHVEGMGQPAAINQIPPALMQWLLKGSGYRAFLVVNKSRMHVEPPEKVHLKLLKEYLKAKGPTGRDALQFYEVVP